MDKDSKDGGGVTWIQGTLISLVLGAGAIFFVDVPYRSERYPDVSEATGQSFGEQDVDARLWQDPLSVVQAAREAAKSAHEPASAADLHAHGVDSLRADILASVESTGSQA